MATKEQIRRIYGMGAVLGIKGRDKDDLLHDLVFGITGKTSVKELEDKEAQSVIAELIHRMRFGNPDRPKKTPKKLMEATAWLPRSSRISAGGTATV